MSAGDMASSYRARFVLARVLPRVTRIAIFLSVNGKSFSSPAENFIPVDDRYKNCRSHGF